MAKANSEFRKKKIIFNVLSYAQLIPQVPSCDGGLNKTIVFPSYSINLIMFFIAVAFYSTEVAL